jgi:hypothetical protein
MKSPLLLTKKNAQHHRSGRIFGGHHNGDFCDVPQSHLLFFLFTFWSLEKFFSSEKKMSWLLAAGAFSLFNRILALANRLSLVAAFINWPFLKALLL